MTLLTLRHQESYTDTTRQSCEISKTLGSQWSNPYPRQITSQKFRIDKIFGPLRKSSEAVKIRGSTSDRPLIFRING